MTARWSTTMAVRPIARPMPRMIAAVGRRRRGVVLDRLAGVDEQVVEGQHHVGRGQAVPEVAAAVEPAEASDDGPTSWTRATPVPRGGEHPAEHAGRPRRRGPWPAIGRTHVFGVNSVVSGQRRPGEPAPARGTPESRPRLMAPPPGLVAPARAAHTEETVSSAPRPATLQPALRRTGTQDERRSRVPCGTDPLRGRVAARAEAGAGPAPWPGPSRRAGAGRRPGGPAPRRGR